MIIEYTQKEKEQLKEIDNRYARQLDELDERIKKYTENEPEYDKIVSEHYDLEYARLKEMGTLQREFEKERFEKLGNDPAAILADAKKQVNIIIPELYEYGARYKYNTETGEENTDPRIEKKKAVDYLNHELRLYNEALNKEPEYKKELRKFIYDYLDNSEYVKKTPRKSNKKRAESQLPDEVQNLFNAPYVTALGGELTNILYDLSIRSFTQESKFSDTGSMEINGIKVKLKGIGQFGEMSTSTLKLWDAITAYLAENNPYGIKDGVNTYIEIPLQEYAKIRGVSITPKQMNSEAEQKKENRRASNRKTNFKSDIERDLNRLSKFCITAKVAKGKTAGDYDNLVLIYPDHSIDKDTIKINMPEDTAKYLLNAYPFYYAPELQSVSDSNPNIYRIGRKILSYNSIDNNARKGTNNTLKVKTLISFTPFIPSLETLQNNHQRNWREKIKEPLETVLNRLTENGTLKKWQYENPRTKEVLSSEDASNLSASTYWNLNVQFTLKSNNSQQKRIIEKEAAAREAKEKSGTGKKKSKKSSEKITPR